MKRITYAAEFAKTPDFNGAAYLIRTDDLSLTRRLLYQLS
jgi:hypothetical protein